MIVVRLTGGLGNQMFQYAAGRATSLRNNTSLLLETFFFEDQIGREAHEKIIVLDMFPEIKKQGLISIEKRKLIDTHVNSHGRIQQSYNKLRSFIKLPPTYQKFEEQLLLTYQANFHQQKAKLLYLASDFQNEMYFIKYQDIIRQDFTFPELSLNSVNNHLLQTITSCNSVSIHVRRGDYVNSNTHQPTSAEYYTKAINLISSKISSAVFFIFSDDIEWCKKNLSLPNSHFINHNTGSDSYIDMQLMSNCKHNIIANSSFSWWGAWLNNNPNKIVISPEIWLSKSAIKAENIVPNNWVRI